MKKEKKVRKQKETHLGATLLCQRHSPVSASYIPMESFCAEMRRPRCRSSTCSCSSRLAGSSQQYFTSVAMHAASTSRECGDDERRQRRRITMPPHQPQARSAASPQQARALHGRRRGRMSGRRHLLCGELRTLPPCVACRENVYENVYPRAVPENWATVAPRHFGATW